MKLCEDGVNEPESEKNSTEEERIQKNLRRLPSQCTDEEDKDAADDMKTAATAPCDAIEHIVRTQSTPANIQSRGGSQHKSLPLSIYQPE